MKKETYIKLKTALTLELFKTDEEQKEIVAFIDDYITFSDSREKRGKGLKLRRESDK